MSERTNRTPNPPASVETWVLNHPERGQIQVHIGPDVLLRELDPGFPVAVASGKTDDADSEADPDSAELDRHLQKLGLDDVKRRVLVAVDGVVYARLEDLGDRRVSLQPKTLKALADGKFTDSTPVPKTPWLKLDSNLLDSWMRTIVYKDDGQPGIDLDPPEGSRAATRYAAMAASPWKRVVYPLTAGLGKGGGALAAIILIPIIGAVLRPVLDWLLALLPDVDIDIPWPEVDIRWPDLNIPWPDWSLPDITAPGWVLFLVEYSKVWIPVLIGVVVGVIAVRRYRRSQETKRRWRQDGDADPGKLGRDG